MLELDKFNEIINTLRGKLDETTVALVSEDLLNITSTYANASDEYSKMGEQNKKLQEEKEELLKVNGRLYQKIGFDKVEEETKNEFKQENNIEEIKIEDVINEKGEII